jgi:hypothetical protein
MKRNRFALAFAAVSLFVAALGNIAMADERAAHAPLKGDGENLKLVKNIQTGKCDSWAGTDHENVEFGKKTYSFATSTCSLAEGGGVHVIDITNPL